MFELSFGEILVIGMVALVVIGPERLPKVARTAGVLLGRLQRFVASVKSDISRDVDLQQLRQLQADVQASAQDIEQSLRQKNAEFREEMSDLERQLWQENHQKHHQVQDANLQKTSNHPTLSAQDRELAPDTPATSHFPADKNLNHNTPPKETAHE